MLSLRTCSVYIDPASRHSGLVPALRECNPVMDMMLKTTWRHVTNSNRTKHKTYTSSFLAIL